MHAHTHTQSLCVSTVLLKLDLRYPHILRLGCKLPLTGIYVYMSKLEDCITSKVLPLTNNRDKKYLERGYQSTIFPKTYWFYLNRQL